MGEALGVIGLGIAAVGAVGSFASSRKAEKAQRRAATQQRLALEEQRKQEEIAFKRKQKEILRETLRQRARTVATAAAQGISFGSSPVQGALAQATSQGAFAQSVANQDFAFAGRIGAFNTASNKFISTANSLTTRASTFGGISSLGGSLYSSSKDLAKLLGEP